MPKQLPVIPLATLLANSQYVKESQYTPRPTRKRKRSSRSKGNAPQKQKSITQPEVTPVSVPDGSQQQIIPVATPVISPRHVQDSPAYQRRIIVQNVSVSVEVQSDLWQQQPWADDHHQAASTGWQPEPPPAQPPVQEAPGNWPPDVLPSEETIPEWVVTLIAFIVSLIVSLISTILFWHIFL